MAWNGPQQTWGRWGNGNAKRGISLALTLNAVAASPLAAYRGRDANLVTWPPKIGQALTLGGASANPTLGVVTGKVNPDDAIAVTFADPGNYYQAGNNAYCDDDGASDYVVECVFNPGANTGGDDTIASHYVGGTGMLIYRNSAASLGGSGCTTTLWGGLSPSTWYHGFYVTRRGGNTRHYINGGLVSSMAPTGLASVAAPLQFNGYSAAHTSPGPCSLAWFAMWSGVNLAAGATAEMDAVALARSKAAGF